MSQMAIKTLKEVDVILFIVDDCLLSDVRQSLYFDLMKEVDTPKILLINKIDKLSQMSSSRLMKNMRLQAFYRIFGISALQGKNVDRVLSKIMELIDEDKCIFPKT